MHCFILPLLPLFFLLGGVLLSVRRVEDTYGLSGYSWVLNGAILLFLPLYFLLYSLVEKGKKNKLEKQFVLHTIDFEYYRQALEETTPAVMALLYKKYVNTRLALFASLLYLEKRGYIHNKAGVYHLTAKPYNQPHENLAYILRHLSTIVQPPAILDTSEKNDAMRQQEEWNALVEKEAEEKGYIVPRKMARATSLVLVILLFEIIYLIIAGANPLSIVLSGVLLFLAMFLKLGAFMDHRFALTQKGYNLYQKINGLANFIADFSLLAERQVKEIKLWDEYLIYAIILNWKSALAKDALAQFEALGKAALEQYPAPDEQTRQV